MNQEEECFLIRVYSPNMRNKILGILQSSDASHRDRLWLAGFLHYCGYGIDDIIEIIDTLNKWNDYNPIITKKQVLSIVY